MKVALVIKTDNLDYDDRIRKEILSLQKKSSELEFTIFALLPDNTQSIGVTSYGVPFVSIKLKSRDRYPSAKYKLIKSLDFYNVIKNEIKNYDIVWLSNVETWLLVLLIKCRFLIWDLHELPTRFISGRLKRMFLKCLFKKADLIIHANEYRVDYLKDIKAINNTEKHIVIHNYPNFEDVDTEYDDNYKKFLAWKGNDNCMYLQGVNNNSRAAYESVKALLNKNHRVVIIGGYDQEAKKQLLNEYEETFISKHIYFAGKVKQLKIPQYISQCLISLVFYKHTRANNIFCEANRFYQSIILGVPVVVGNNPPMKALIDDYEFGISVNTDGSNIEEIEKGIEIVLNNRDYYVERIIDNMSHILWTSQENIFIEIINRINNKIK